MRFSAWFYSGFNITWNPDFERRWFCFFSSHIRGDNRIFVWFCTMNPSAAADFASWITTQRFTLRQQIRRSDSLCVIKPDAESFVNILGTILHDENQCRDSVLHHEIWWRDSLLVMKDDAEIHSTPSVIARRVNISVPVKHKNRKILFFWFSIFRFTMEYIRQKCMNILFV